MSLDVSMSRKDSLFMVSFLELNLIFLWHELKYFKNNLSLSSFLESTKMSSTYCLLKTLVWIPLGTYLTIFFHDSIKELSKVGPSEEPIATPSYCLWKESFINSFKLKESFTHWNIYHRKTFFNHLRPANKHYKHWKNYKTSTFLIKHYKAVAWASKILNKNT